MKLEPQQTINNRYQIIERIGQGGMGEVWKALDVRLGDEVVIKTPLSQHDPEMIARFAKEALSMRKFSLDCPHILNIEDVGEIDGLPWYAMRYLAGGSLRNRVLSRNQDGEVEWNKNSFDWLIKISAALDFLHERKAFHRDVKPENILFSPESTPYLVDFGIVKTASETTSMMTEQGKTVGTLAYMSPEILEGEKFTPQADQYALAVTLYETITGDRPFSGTTFFALFKSIQKGHEKLVERCPEIPSAGSEIVDRALSPNVGDRFNSCSGFASAFISGLSAGGGASEAPTGMMPILGGKPIAQSSLDEEVVSLNEPAKTGPNEPLKTNRIARPLLLAAALLVGLGGIVLYSTFPNGKAPVATLNESSATEPASVGNSDLDSFRESEGNRNSTSGMSEIREPDSTALTKPARAEISKPESNSDTPDEEPQKTPIPSTGKETKKVASQPAKLKPLSFAFDDKNEAFAWEAKLGSASYNRPATGRGKVFVGTNNYAGYRDGIDGEQDKGVLICFDDTDGKFLWQLTRDKLESGRVNDWPLQGIFSQPWVDGDRLWMVTNRGEIMCLDTEGFLDGENDGPYKNEELKTHQDADIVWSLDMIEELGVFPHNKAFGDPVVFEDLLFINTSNGVDEAHLNVPSPRAPSFLAINKNTGKVVWENGQPSDEILHSTWASPQVAVIKGQPQVFFPGGDGWLYAFDVPTGELIWKCDLNPKDSVFELGGAGTRNSVLARPVVYKESVIIGVGQSPEYGENVGHLWRIDATKTGDVSLELGEIGKKGRPNPNSGIIWHYGGEEADPDADADTEYIFGSTLSSPAITPDGLLLIADLTGYFYCLDVETGKRHWKYDFLSGVWASPRLYRNHVLIGNEDGQLCMFKATKTENKPKEFDTVNYGSIYATLHIDGDKIYAVQRDRLTKFDFDPTTQRQAISPSSKNDSASAKPLEKEITNSIGMKFRLIPAGKFLMGSPEDEGDRYDDETQHRVDISHDFYLGKFEVTQRQWKSLMGTEPWKGKGLAGEGDDHAASHVSWNDAVEFCKILSEREGSEYRLPSEAEWEYACRGGTKTAFSFGEDASELVKHAWFEKNSTLVGEKHAHEVGEKRGNSFGLHDMHGNVWEWCADWYGEYANSPVRDPKGLDDGSDRVYRGGGWDSSPQRCRCSSRDGDWLGIRSGVLGFRVLRSSSMAGKEKRKVEDARQRQGAESPISRSSADSPGELSASQVLSRINAYLNRTNTSIVNFKSLFPEYGRIINGLKRSEKMQVGGLTIAFPSKQVWKTRPDIRESIIRVLTENGVL